MNEVKRNDLLYPELSFQIVGCAFEVHNKMGFGFKEAIYQKALSLAFKEKGLSYKEQVLFEIKFKEHVLGKRFFDFIVDDKIVVEIKRDDKFSKANIDQTIEYLRISGLKLALLINFGREGVLSKRLIKLTK
ncbi:MAG: 3 family protein [Bacteroidetes bacterium]|nr:3 family protein [Bacteroidota bacterium]